MLLRKEQGKIEKEIMLYMLKKERGREAWWLNMGGVVAQW
jgi:hypothetical protein